MEKIGNIKIRIDGRSGNVKLSPDNYDIKEIITVLQAAENLLFPTTKKNRPTISYTIQAGSVEHIIKTSLQAVIGFNAIIGQVESRSSVDFLESQSAQAIEILQENAIKNNFNLSISTSIEDSNELIITKDSKLVRTQNVWVEAEFYFYGILTNAGGKNKANIHLDTEELGTLIIQTDKDFLGEKEENLLYKKFGIRALGKQNIQTHEVDKSSLKLIELINYTPKFDQAYLEKLMNKASSKWSEVNNVDDWLRSIRGDYEA